MAPRLFRCELLFQQFGNGWTEKYARWIDGPKLAANFPLAIINKLLSFRHASVLLYAIRASNPLQPFDEYLRVYNYHGDRGGSTVDNEDLVTTSALIRTISGSNHKGSMYLRGLADQDVKRSGFTGGSLPSDLLEAAIQDLQTLFQNDATFGMEVPTPADVAGFGWQTVDSIRPHATNPNMTVIKLMADLPSVNVPAAAGQPPAILMRGVSPKILPAMQGQFRVVAVDHGAKEFTVFYTWRSNLQSYNPPRAYARPWYPQISTMSEFAFQRFTRRDTGLPTIRSRGRRRAAVSRH